jgi:uncharacterized membrane protein (DUF4010 family)
VIELSSRLADSGGRLVDAAYRGILFATAAMLVRNAGLLLILAPLALLNALPAFGLMFIASAALALLSYSRRQAANHGEASRLNLALPFSLPVALKYGFLFLLLHIVGSIMQRQFGSLGFYAVTVLGGLMSSASAVAAAATLAAQGTMPASVAGKGAVIASFTSIAFSLSFVLRTGERTLIRRLAIAMLWVALGGLVGVFASDTVEPVISRWLDALDRL